jgi:1-aminocyclopropane-1-carboxylate deaminase
MATIEPVDESRICIQALDGFAGDSTTDVSMLRLDLVHPLVSGNKWYKLKHNIEGAVNAGKKSILSFGGAYSNHLVAVAAAAHAHGLASIGIVRGEEQVQNSVLDQCKAYGMALHFISRQQYAAKMDPVFTAILEQRFPEAYLVPEGGANAAGERGAAEIAGYIDRQFTHVAVSVGTGTTFIGLRRMLSPDQLLLGFVPMKGGAYLAETISRKTGGNQGNWQLYDRFHFGGFGRSNEDLQTFMHKFRERYGFELDRVYTAKMMMGIGQLIRERGIPEGARVLCIHTGGLTGN